MEGSEAAAADRIAVARLEAALRREVALNRVLQAVGSVAGTAGTLEDAIQGALEAICRELDCAVGHAYFPGPNQPNLLLAALIWHLSDPEQYAQFVAASKAASFRPGQGLVGTVLETGRPHWIADVRTSPLYLRREAAATAGLAAGFALPVALDGQVVAVLEFYRLEPEEPDPRLLETFAAIGQQLGRVFERQRASQALRAREEYLRYIAIHSRSILWHGTVEERGEPLLAWHVREADPDAAQRFFPLEPVPGQSYMYTWYRSRQPDDRQRVDEYAAALVRAGRSYTQEFRARDATGQLRWIREDVSIEPLEPGKWRAVGICLDVTEAKRAEQRDATFRSLGEALNSALTFEDAARTILGAADSLFGWDACWLDLCDPETRRVEAIILIDEIDGQRTEVPGDSQILPENSLVMRAVRGGPLLILEPEEEPPGLRFGDQSRISASIMAVPIRVGARPIGALSIQSYEHDRYSEADLQTFQALADYCAGALERTRAEAERRSLEQQLLQSQKLEAIGRLAGGVAHDFNNMLAVINGYADLLLMRDDLPEALRYPISEMRSAGDRAAALTGQLLAFSRRSLIQPQVLQLDAVLQELESMLGRLIGEDIKFFLDLQAGVAQVNVDRSQLDQVVLNLVVNARDAMPRGGFLWLRTEALTPEEAGRPDAPELRPGAYVVLTVTDTGRGITPDLLARVWEPFFTTKGPGDGSGLGLATVYGIVKQNNGHVSVESEPDHGATFRVYLPRVDVAEAPAPQARQTVLVVEPEETMRSFIQDVLEAAGLQVIAAGSLAEALREPPERFELLLVDVSLPAAGLEVVDRLRQQRPETRMLLMSGYGRDTLLRHGLAAEAPFLQKPFTPRALTEKVRQLLGAE